MIRGPERATLADYEAILEIADTCFPHDRELGGMLARWPHCYLEDPRAIRNFLLIRDDGRPVSVVEYVDHVVKIGEGRVQVGGLTAVATLPSYRRRGFMTRLLERCIQCMGEEGYALSELGGYRLRYNRFGWENGGLEWRFDVDPRCLHERSRDDRYRVAPYERQPEALQAIVAIHDGELVGLERSAALTVTLLQRGGYETWLAQDPAGVAAYVTCYVDEDGERSVAEFGGHPEGICAILCHLIDDVGTRGLSIKSPRAHPFNEIFSSVSWRWGLAFPRMIKIIDLRRTLDSFAGQLLARCQQVELRKERSVALVVEETGQQVQVNLSPDRVSLSPVGKGTLAIRLPERAMVRLLFCPRGLGLWTDLPAGVRLFASLLPLDLFIWPLERV